MNFLKSSHGFTLLELMMTLGLIIILCGIAVPATRAQMQTFRFRSASLELYGLFIFTRSEAMRCGQPVGLFIENQRILIFMDQDRSGDFSAKDIQLKSAAFPDAFHILDKNEGTSRTTYIFNHRGMTTHWGSVVFESTAGKAKITVSNPSNIRISDA